MRPNPEIGRISAPYKIKALEHILLKNNPPIASTDWSNSLYNPLKENIKSYYSVIQNDYCAFCRTKINFKGYNEPIEHVVNKNRKIGWMFNPLNLVLACDECNTRKGIKHTLRKPYRSLTTMPIGSQFYRIVHPHFDNYEDHITIEHNLFYRAVTRDKGFFTIIICGLWHFQLLMKRAEVIKIGSLDLYRNLAHRMKDINIHKVEKRNIRAVMNDIIDRRTI